ncbi:MAG: hypothetical protein QHH80_02185 [Anaerolineae bacterium]|nr:hypothetical protein [Anaerolineae bacterium]
MPNRQRLRLYALSRILHRIDLFSRHILARPLRGYQLAPARAIVDSVLRRRGLTFAVMMSRQAGKNELSAQVEAYLLALHSRVGGTLVKAAPTFAPQAVVSMERLAALLDNPLTRGRVVREHGNILTLGKARAVFLSAHPEANVVGQTASILLECDEAQDVDPDKWDKDFAPMGASANVTTVFYGTAWTRHTLLARVVHELRAQEARDGIRRVFLVPADVVAAELPAYAAHLEKEVARMGRMHPLIRTQYFLEELDAGAGMFPPERRTLMQGSHPPHLSPQPDCAYAFLLDVGGPAQAPFTLPLFPDEALGECAPDPDHDATALTIVAIDADDAVSLPVYRVVHRRAWVGVDHRTLYGQIRALAEAWNPAAIVADATGVGAGLTDLLRSALGERVIPVVFSATKKSDIGWRFMAACDAGRVRDHAACGGEGPFAATEALRRQFWEQVEAAQVEYLPGPGQRIRWGVPESAGHDDLLVSAALCVVLDDGGWGCGGSVLVRNPVREG